MKRGNPEHGEVVICRITRLFPNSAEAEMLEYGKTGMIHVSEVASRWVRDIREFLKENQYVVCRVVGMDQRGVSLSMKRVRREEGERALKEFKREKKAEAMLEQLAKTMKKSRDEAFQEAGYLLQEEFGSLSKAFEIAGKNPELLKAKRLPGAWEKAILELAQKKFAEKTYRLKGELELSILSPDGMDVIKGLLLGARKKGFEVSYIAAPRYSLALEGKDVKKLRIALEEEGNALAKVMEKQGGEGRFTLKQ